MIPQPRGRPRDNCTWDMRTGQWLPTAGFNGIAPPAKKPKATRGERFNIVYAQPQPRQMQVSEDLIAKQRALFDASKDRERREREDEKMYAENLRRNQEEARIYREKEEARQAKLAAEAAAEANRVANLPINIAKRLFPRPLSYPVYYYDAGHMKLLHDKTLSTTSTIPQQKKQAPQVVFDELRDILWPQLADLSRRRSAIRIRLNKYNTYMDSTPVRYFVRYRQQILSIMLELWQINLEIHPLAKRQRDILQASWRTGNTDSIDHESF